MGLAAEAVPWWEPQSFGVALATALLSTACWGSWSNTAKAAGGSTNFAHFYTDFCVAVFLAALLFLAGPGGCCLGTADVDAGRAWLALAAGSLFGVANLLLTTGIALAGLSVAFPICIGTGLVLGTVLTYLVDERGRPEFIFPGVALALLGVLSNARAYAALKSTAEEDGSSPGDSGGEEERRLGAGGSSRGTSSDEATAPGGHSFARLVTMCIVGGLLMGTWAPLSARSMQGAAGLSPYASFACFTFASLAVSLAILAGQQHGCSVVPRVDTVTSATEYFKLRPALHGWGFLGGFIWALGTLANLVSGGHLGFALSYALGQTAPVVAVLWGLLWYHEFRGAPREAVLFLAAMFALFAGAIVLLVIGGS